MYIDIAASSIYLQCTRLFFFFLFLARRNTRQIFTLVVVIEANSLGMSKDIRHISLVVTVSHDMCKATQFLRTCTAQASRYMQDMAVLLSITFEESHMMLIQKRGIFAAKSLTSA